MCYAKETNFKRIAMNITHESNEELKKKHTKEQMCVTISIDEVYAFLFPGNLLFKLKSASLHVIASFGNGSLESFLVSFLFLRFQFTSQLCLQQPLLHNH